MVSLNPFAAKASVPLTEDKTIRRSFLSPDQLLTTPNEEIRTVADVFPFIAKKYGNRRAAMSRKIIETVTEEKEIPKKGGQPGETEKKKWTYFVLEDPKEHTYTSMMKDIEDISAGLKALGLGDPKRSDEDGKERVSIYADTSVNWQLMSHSLARMGIPLATAYTTLGPEGLQHSLTEPSCRAIFTNASLLPTVAKVLEDCPTVSFLIYDNEHLADKSLLEKLNATLTKREVPGRVIGLEELKKLGQEIPVGPEAFGEKPKPDDLFCIMYTSGSTGAPKGVVITHRNAISALAGTESIWGPYFRPDDIFIAFLPLAHILELLVEMTFYWCGITLAYGNPKTLTDESVRKCRGDFMTYKPSLLVAVPQIYETIRKGIMKKVHEAGAVAGSVFNIGYALKRNVPLLGGVVDRIVFAKVKQATGGRLRLAMNGGAPLSKSTQEFLTTALVTVMSGYGATETCGMAAISIPKFPTTGSVGVIVPSNEIKLKDYEEAGYRTTNNPPQGEVWIRGGSVIKGYYKREDLSGPDCFEDGFFKTGDIGQWNPDGTLSLIDRIKNLVKLRSGEYLAIEKVESIYGTTDIVQQICVYADGEAEKPIAIVIPHEGNLRNALKSAGISADGALHEIVKKKEVNDFMFKALQSSAQKGGLRGQELLQGVILDDEIWAPDNGKTTATNKPKRSTIAKEFQKEIKALYGRQ